MDREVAELVLNRNIDPEALRAGILQGYERLLVADETYPALAPRAGGKVTGVLLDNVDAHDLARMQFFESEEFAPAECDIELLSGEYVIALTFIARDVLRYTEQPWNYAHWQRHDKNDYLLLVREWMDEYGKREAHELEPAWSSARYRQLDASESGGEHQQRQKSGGKTNE